MGLCASSATSSATNQNTFQDETQKNALIDERQKNDMVADQQVHKLLLLGAGESGKTTLFRQINSIYNTNTFNDDDKRRCYELIQHNVISCMTAILNFIALKEVGVPANTEAVEFFRNIHIPLHADDSSSLQESGVLLTSPSVSQYIASLWADPVIQQAWMRRNEYHVFESAEYFFNKIHEISQPTYEPTFQDSLRVRVRTSGVIEIAFNVDNQNFKVVDVGGQRNERKKWIYCFDGVTAIIFVAAISEYDQTLYEDENVNRLHEALKLYEDISNSRWFRDKPILLFLNKRDLFNEKIMRVPLSQYHPEYTGPEKDPIAAQEWIAERFKSKHKTPDRANVYVHVTCATDTTNIRTVFTAVKDIIIRASLYEAGFIS